MRIFRFFYAVMPDDALRQRIVAATEALELGWFIPARPHQLHVTVRFLGQVQAERDQDMAHALIRACARHAPFSIDIEGGGVFGDSAAWLGAKDGGALAALSADLDAELATRGFPPRNHPFLPHVTIARSRGNMAHFDLDGLINAPHVGSMRVGEVVLISSRMTAFGPEYTVQSRAALM